MNIQWNTSQQSLFSEYTLAKRQPPPQKKTKVAAIRTPRFWWLLSAKPPDCTIGCTGRTREILSFAKTDSTLDDALLRLDSVKGDRAGKLRITHLQQEALPGDYKFARQRTFLF